MTLFGETQRAFSNTIALPALLDALKACSKTRNLEKGKQVHLKAIERGYDYNIYILNALVNMYAKCGSMVDALNVFDRIKHPNVVSWTALISGYAANGQGLTALALFTRMRVEGSVPDCVTMVAALKACTSLSGTEDCRDRGKEIHNVAVENGSYSDVYMQSTLIDMYSKCGGMVDARMVFENLKHATVVSWTALILGYAENNQCHTALEMFSRMKTEGFLPNFVTLVAVVKACTSLAVIDGAGHCLECIDRCKEVHNLAVQDGCNSNVYLQNSLIDMYAKCGSMVDAYEVFDGMKHPDVVSWTALILGYAENGRGHTALDMFTGMRTEGLAPNFITIVAALKACASFAVTNGSSGSLQCKDESKKICNIAVENGFNSNVYMQTTLVDMYAACGSMLDARDVFDNMKHPDAVLWTTLILGYAENGQAHTALEIFTRMRIEGPEPDSVTFTAVLKACGLVGALEFGRTIHSGLGSGNNLDSVLVNCLVDFYAKCGSLVEAQRVFDLHSKTRDMITWNALLAGFSSCGDSCAVFGLFEEMQDAGVRPNGITFLCILTCCCHAGLVVKGKECLEAMSTIYDVIPNVKHYTCMIDLFGRSNKFDDAMVLLDRMPCSPDEVTWMTLLGACRKWKNAEIGRMAFQSLIDLNVKDASAYVLMGQIYYSRGMLQEQSKVMGLRKKVKAVKKPEETCWTNEAGYVHAFLAEDCKHPQKLEISEKWKSMDLVMRQHGYTPNLTDADKEEELCGHSEKLALICALINTEAGKTVRIVKNLRVCDDCHIAIALISELEFRTIICRDARRIHVFKDGKCSCGDLW